MDKITKQEQKNVFSFVAGVILFFLFFQSLNNINTRINYVRSDTLSYLAPWLTIAVFFLLTYLLLKISRYLGLGFFLALPAGALGIALLLLEIIIHPPEE